MYVYINNIFFFPLVLPSYHCYLQKNESGISNITRDELWCKAHTKKNGDPPNSVVADCIVSFLFIIKYFAGSIFTTIAFSMLLVRFSFSCCNKVVYSYFLFLGIDVFLFLLTCSFGSQICFM